MVDTRLPRAERVKPDPDLLYSVNVVERELDRVKVHYCGYSSRFDEWRDVDDVVSVEGEAQALQVEPYRPFELHRYVLNTHVLSFTYIYKFFSAYTCTYIRSHQHNCLFLTENCATRWRWLSIQAWDMTQRCVLRCHMIHTFLPEDFNKLDSLSGHTGGMISRYADLTPLLGERWYIRGLNPKGFVTWIPRLCSTTCINVSHFRTSKLMPSQ